MAGEQITHDQAEQATHCIAQENASNHTEVLYAYITQQRSLSAPPATADARTAEEIAERAIKCPHDPGACNVCWRKREVLAAAIRAALAVPKGYVRVEGGALVNTTGVLPRLADGTIRGGISDDHGEERLWARHPADGEVIECGSRIWWSELDDWRVTGIEPCDTEGNCPCFPLSWCYSTHAAAVEAAARPAKVNETCPVCGSVNDADKEHNCGIPAAESAAREAGEGERP